MSCQDVDSDELMITLSPNMDDMHGNLSFNFINTILNPVSLAPVCEQLFSTFFAPNES